MSVHARDKGHFLQPLPAWSLSLPLSFSLSPPPQLTDTMDKERYSECYSACGALVKREQRAIEL